jgi:hypothetical protein
LPRRRWLVCLVLIAAGCAGPAPSPSATPKTDAGTFAATGELKQARAYHTATLLVDGRVLITGGISGTTALASAEL